MKNIKLVIFLLIGFLFVNVIFSSTNFEIKDISGNEIFSSKFRCSYEYYSQRPSSFDNSIFGRDYDSMVN